MDDRKKADDDVTKKNSIENADTLTDEELEQVAGGVAASHDCNTAATPNLLTVTTATIR